MNVEEDSNYINANSMNIDNIQFKSLLRAQASANEPVNFTAYSLLRSNIKLDYYIALKKITQQKRNFTKLYYIL